MYLNIRGPYERYYYCHIRKCAGAAINRIFLNAIDNESGFMFGDVGRGNVVYYKGLVFAGETRDFIENGRFLYASSLSPFHEMRIPDRTFIFSTFRDPAARILSLYRTLLRQRDLPEKNDDSSAECQWLGDSFMDFLDTIPQRELMRQLYMFSPSFDVGEAYNCIRRLGAYFFVEDMDCSLRMLSSLFNVPLCNTTVNHGCNTIALSPPEAVRLRTMLKDEYRLVRRLRQAYNTFVFPKPANVAGA
ncbi:hypothetical protein GGQ74_000478 [Desulfobaculum xiamenense]|uniref:Sulfotransferase family protein n=1 Tax=Desulfobaculum xiamenense TaxID=995050 RepID=A0A846QEQ5_9BACT|nr:sulfotransferase family 2 domain-containing protein [Desulfobaculum xiamenense]NJB66838.1 hypothetical protein [Desulfobaculum xiamenense]